MNKKVLVFYRLLCSVQMGFFHAGKEVVTQMASRIQGTTVEIGGDTTKLSKALESVNKSIKGTQSGLKERHLYLSGSPECCGQKDRSGHQPASFPEKI
mgnify:CR=1 FL=1